MFTLEVFVLQDIAWNLAIFTSFLGLDSCLGQRNPSCQQRNPKSPGLVGYLVRLFFHVGWC